MLAARHWLLLRLNGWPYLLRCLETARTKSAPKPNTFQRCCQISNDSAPMLYHQLDALSAGIDLCALCTYVWPYIFCSHWGIDQVIADLIIYPAEHLGHRWKSQSGIPIKVLEWDLGVMEVFVSRETWNILAGFISVPLSWPDLPHRTIYLLDWIGFVFCTI